MGFLQSILVFQLKFDEGHIERFAFDVYMSSKDIIIKIKQLFALHKFFLVEIFVFASTVSSKAIVILFCV